MFAVVDRSAHVTEKVRYLFIWVGGMEVVEESRCNLKTMGVSNVRKLYSRLDLRKSWRESGSLGAMRCDHLAAPFLGNRYFVLPNLVSLRDCCTSSVCVYNNFCFVVAMSQ